MLFSQTKMEALSTQLFHLNAPSRKKNCCMRRMPIFAFDFWSDMNHSTLDVWSQGKQLDLFSRESWTRGQQLRNCISVGIHLNLIGSRDQELTDYSAHFVE